jgi:hypothetical protein
MESTVLQEVAQAVVRRAQRQGFLRPREIQEELQHFGLDPARWKEVLPLAQPPLHYRYGRYYYGNAINLRAEREHRHQQALHHTIRQLIREHKKSLSEQERRRHGRIDFILPVKVQTEDQREMTLLSRDLSTTGIRLIGTRSLLGQKIRVLLPRTDGAEPLCFLVRILWTCTVGDDLFENGGSFLELRTDGAH